MQESKSEIVSNVHVGMIREVFKYAQRFVSKRFVIQISSELFDHRLFPSIVRDLALLQHNGIQLVLVPGARVRIDTVLRQFNKESEFRKGLRISAGESLPLIMMAAFDVANQLMTEFSSQKLSSVIGNWVRARSLGVVDGSDFQMTGTVEKVHSAHIEGILSDGIIPILPCIGWNSVGQAYNISSLELARCVAVELKAEKLFYITDSFFLDAHDLDIDEDEHTLRGGQISSLNAQKTTTFLERNEDRLDKDSYETIAQSAQAVASGVKRAHILNGSVEGVILQEIFSTKGSGTMVHQNPFNCIRPMEPRDMSDIVRIIGPEVERGTLLGKSRNELLASIADFVVYVSDGSIRACAALHCYEAGVAELSTIAVDPLYSNMGIGNHLVAYLLEKAREKAVKKILALTTGASDWFLGMGFSRGTLSDLPAQRHYNNDRNSRVYCLNL